MKRYERSRAITILMTSVLVVTACATERVGEVEQTLACFDVTIAGNPTPPPAPRCGNEVLTAYDGLLLIAPHPDDEVLGFAGLITAYLERGKPVDIIVTTDGDAYCEACRFWKSGTVTGPTCSAAELSNFSTPAVDSFAEVRHTESRAAFDLLGAPAPTFLRYPDTGLATAWTKLEHGERDLPLRRSDFSMCESCENCAGGYGEGPETELTATTLERSLMALIAATSENTLVATTHWLDGHPDHAALGRFVREINDGLEVPRTIAFAVIHARTPKNTAHADCWYPGPPALICPCTDQSCADADPDWVAALRDYRYRPDWPGALPDDADYGTATHLCLSEALYQGENATKLEAIRAYASQLGLAIRQGDPLPARAGIIDCNGYLISFVKSTEAFVVLER